MDFYYIERWRLSVNGCIWNCISNVIRTTFVQTQTKIVVDITLLFLVGALLQGCLNGQAKKLDHDPDLFHEYMDYRSNPNWPIWKKNGFDDSRQIEALIKVIWESGVLINDRESSKRLIADLIDFQQSKKLKGYDIEIALIKSLYISYFGGKEEWTEELLNRNIDPSLGIDDKASLLLSKLYFYLSPGILDFRNAERCYEDLCTIRDDIQNSRIWALTYCAEVSYAEDLSAWGRCISIERDYIEELSRLNMPAFVALTYNDLAIAYANLGEYERAENLWLKANAINLEFGYYLQAHWNLNNLGYLNYQQGFYDKASDHFLKLIDLAGEKQIFDFSALALAYSNLSLISQERGDYVQSMEYLQRALHLYKTKLLRKRDVATSRQRLAILYNEISEYDSALYYIQTAYDDHIILADSMGKAEDEEIIGGIYLNIDSIGKALEFFNKSLNGFSELNHGSMVGLNYLNLAKTYAELNEFEVSETLLKRSQEFYFDAGDQLEVNADLQLELAKMYLRNQQIDSSIYWAELALFSGQNEHKARVQLEAHKELIEAYARNGKYNLSTSHRDAYIYLKDSIHNRDKYREIGYVEATHQYKDEIRKSKFIAGRQKKLAWLYLILTILSVLTIILGLVYLRQRSLRIRLLEQKTRLEKQKNDHLVLKDDLRRKLMVNISHDFRTPLNLIAAPLEEIIEGHRSQNLEDTCQIMLANTKILLNLVNQILDLSKLQEGVTPRFEKTDIVQVLEKAITLYTSYAEVENIELSSYLPDAPVQLNVDIVLLGKILNNLLSNAIKYCGLSGKIELRLNLKEHAYTISVIDNGIGMDREAIAQIFMRHRRIDQSIEEEILTSGGLGLSIIFELVDELGGTIEVESEVGAGSTFRVTIPQEERIIIPEQWMFKKKKYTSTNGGANFQIPGVSGTVNPLMHDLNKPIILIVEDNRSLNDFLATRLKDSFKIIQCFDGQEALEQSKKKIPDLIFTDIVMPKMSGLELAEHLTSDIETSHIPIIFSSMLNEDRLRVSSFRNGGIDFLPKPVSLNKLILKIINLLSLMERQKKHNLAQVSMTSDKAFTYLEDLNSADEELTQRIMVVLKEQIGDPKFNVEELSKRLFMSRVSLFRKLKHILGTTPSQLILKYRMEMAKRLLYKKVGTVKEIAYKVGYTNTSHFSKSFLKYHGIKPSKLLNEFA